MSRGAPPRPLRVLMVAAEVAPFAYTGGLGDVLGGLSSALADAGCDVVIATPRYGVTRAPPSSRWWAETVTARIGWGAGDVRTLGVLEAAKGTHGGRVVRVCFLDHPDLFARDGIYGDAHGAFWNNDVRFAAMSRGALSVAERIWPASGGLAPGPDVIHAHDWHAALAVISPALTMGPRWAAVPTVFTIHNLAFQGVLGPGALDRLALPRAAFEDTPETATLAHDGQVNLMRGAISLADRVTTVSPTYAREILGPREGCGLDAVLRRYEGKLVGIVNGIDETRFDPSTDAALTARYDVASADEGKAACKEALLAEASLDRGGPLFASVCRLTDQKGIDLLLAVLPGLVERGARFVLVGTGDPLLEQALVAAARRFPGRVASRVTFDEALARRVYAGADFFVVPSRYEPCGLTQLYAMRYGAIPIVTPVGGLRDTVTPISSLLSSGTGCVASSADSQALLLACEDALAIHRDSAAHHAAVRRAMQRDSSWASPAHEYLAKYEALLA